MEKHATIQDIPPPKIAFKASEHETDNKVHLLVAATGSVATIKIPVILKSLAKYTNLSIRLVFTNSSLLFLPPLNTLLKQDNVDSIHLNHHEWGSLDQDCTQEDSIIWQKKGDPILHIELRRWADMLLIAPLSANSLAKITGGFSDDLLSSVVRAWDIRPASHKYIVVAPAMNTMMWEHPVTSKQIGILKNEWKWFKVLMPIEKMLACGDSGSGGMMESGDIVSFLVEQLKLDGDKSIVEM